MDGEPEIALLPERGFTGVQAHPHTDVRTPGPTMSRQRTLSGHGPFDCAPRALEYHEEGIPLHVDLAPSMLFERGSQQQPLIGQQLAIAVPQLLEQAGRPLDV